MKKTASRVSKKGVIRGHLKPRAKRRKLEREQKSQEDETGNI